MVLVTQMEILLQIKNNLNMDNEKVIPKDTDYNQQYPAVRQRKDKQEFIPVEILYILISNTKGYHQYSR